MENKTDDTLFLIRFICLMTLVVIYISAGGYIAEKTAKQHIDDNYREDVHYRYKDVDNGLPIEIKNLNNYKQIDGSVVYLVLYRDDCKDCKAAEKELAKVMISSEKKGMNIILLNINGMDGKQLEQFKKEYKDILYNGKIATPTVAKLRSNKKSWKLIKFNNTGDIQQQIKILKGM